MPLRVVLICPFFFFLNMKSVVHLKITAIIEETMYRGQY